MAGRTSKAKHDSVEQSSANNQKSEIAEKVSGTDSKPARSGIISNGDLIEFDFVGRVKTSGQIFDLSSEETAKKEGIYQEGQKYGPAAAVIGKGMLVKGLEKNLEDKEIGKEYDFEIPAEEAFGQRNPSLVQLTNISKFKEFRPIAGMQVNVDGILATVRAVSGGRVTLDFNHPMAGKALLYHVKVLRKISGLAEKVKLICEKFLGLTADVKAEGNKLTIKAKTSDGKELDKAVEARLAEELKKLVEELKDKEIIFAKQS
ncbi:MAG: peptidylprolyl isomerase [DPANN group archaeon]|nr:peptidylprolyl isomerase [DPANN group archaeon]